MSDVVLHPEAYDDIDEIRSYMAEDSPDAADRMVNEVFERIRLLAQVPSQGFRRPNFTCLPLRFVAVRLRKTPRVVAVIHGRRSPRVISAILRGRE